MKTIVSGLLVMYFTTVIHGEICCTPRKWEGFQYIESTLFEPDPVVAVNISYDADKKKIAVSGTTVKDGIRNKFKIIDDYSQSTRYLIDPENEVCTEDTTIGSVFPEYCIPDNATSSGMSYVGVGGKTLNVTAYTYNKNLYDVKAFVVVTQDACLPVLADARGKYKNTTGFVEILNYIQITAGINDTTVFDPPDYCYGNPGLY